MACVGSPADINLVTPPKRTRVTGTVLPLLDSVVALSAIPAADLPLIPASFAVWSLASKLALDLVCRERVVPVVVRTDDQSFVRWAAALADAEDSAQVVLGWRVFRGSDASASLKRHEPPGPLPMHLLF